MNPEEVKQAQEVIDSFVEGRPGELKPLTPVFPKEAESRLSVEECAREIYRDCSEHGISLERLHVWESLIRRVGPQWECSALAAKVRGYFTNPITGNVDIPKCLDGDRDLYETASRITQQVIQPGKRSALPSPPKE